MQWYNALNDTLASFELNKNEKWNELQLNKLKYSFKTCRNFYKMKLKIKTLLIDIWLFKYTLSGTTIYVYINKPVYIYIVIMINKRKKILI